MLSKIQMRALETCCYVIGAGAFGVFIRWLQNVAGTNEEGLYNNSVWGVLVPLILIAGAFVFIGMVRKLNKDRLYIDADHAERSGYRSKSSACGRASGFSDRSLFPDHDEMVR